MELENSVTLARPGEAPDGTLRQRQALDALYSASYEELRRIASAVRRSDPGATASATTLVNEAWMKLARSPDFICESAIHFKRIAARAMRQLLVEAARRKHAEKRGGDYLFITFDESVGQQMERASELLALDAALEQLAALNARQAMVVECRFFAGMEVAEIVQELQISEATVLRDWRAARAWLGAQIRKQENERLR